MNSIVHRMAGPAALISLLGGCGAPSSNEPSFEAVAVKAAGAKFLCVFRPRPGARPIVVVTGAVARGAVRSALASARPGVRFDVRIGQPENSAQRRGAVEADVRDTQPPLDERVHVSVTRVAPADRGTPDAGKQQGMLCGYTRVEVDGIAPTPKAYQSWIDGLHVRLPIEVQVIDNTIIG